MAADVDRGTPAALYLATHRARRAMRRGRLWSWAFYAVGPVVGAACGSAVLVSRFDVPLPWALYACLLVAAPLTSMIVVGFTLERAVVAPAADELRELDAEAHLRPLLGVVAPISRVE